MSNNIPDNWKEALNQDPVTKDANFPTMEEAAKALIAAAKAQAARILDEHLYQLSKSIAENENYRLLGTREDEAYDESQPFGMYPDLKHRFAEKGGLTTKRFSALGLLVYNRYSDGTYAGSEFMASLRKYWLPLYEVEAVQRLTEDLNCGQIKIREY